MTARFPMPENHDRRSSDQALYRELYAHMEVLATKVSELTAHVSMLTVMASKIEHNGAEIERLRAIADRVRDQQELNISRLAVLEAQQRHDTSHFTGSGIYVKPITITLFVAATGWIITMFLKLLDWSR